MTPPNVKGKESSGVHVLIPQAEVLKARLKDACRPQKGGH